MKSYIHARLAAEDRAALEELKAKTGLTESEIVRRGLQLVARTVSRMPRRKGPAPPGSALELAGRRAGRFKSGPSDLSTNRKHLEDFGQ